MLKRTKTVFNVNGLPAIKAKLFSWAAHSSPMAWYDSNEYPHQNNTYDAILALHDSGRFSLLDSCDALKKAIGLDWLFGYFTYEYTNSWEQVEATNPSHIPLPKLQFFCPEKIWLLKGNTLTALYTNHDDAKNDYRQILAAEALSSVKSTTIDLISRISKADYLKNATALQRHIFRGDIYEVNYCMEWFAENTYISPPHVFQSLNAISKTPFAAYLAMENLHLMCASPERFLTRKGTQILSQPIKGTAARFLDEYLDNAAAQQLKIDPKERSENIMITDLVRNDLSRIAERGSVAVTEQCVVYPFAQVHQMISTVVASCAKKTHSLDIVDACFPMGSMTGAPKQRAMELINVYETTQRGLYSGAVGYFTPTGDFDFNVVIRSLIYNAQDRYLSTHVGSALTAVANVEKEYEECQLKAEAIKRVLRNQHTASVGHGTKV